jgi:hypothetical protein
MKEGDSSGVRLEDPIEMDEALRLMDQLVNRSRRDRSTIRISGRVFEYGKEGPRIA